MLPNQVLIFCLFKYYFTDIDWEVFNIWLGGSMFIYYFTDIDWEVFNIWLGGSMEVLSVNRIRSQLQKDMNHLASCYFLYSSLPQYKTIHFQWKRPHGGYTAYFHYNCLQQNRKWKVFKKTFNSIYISLDSSWPELLFSRPWWHFLVFFSIKKG